MNIFESANTTTTTNTGFGIKCMNGAIADGRRGSLNGAAGPTSFKDTCVNSLVP